MGDVSKHIRLQINLTYTVGEKILCQGVRVTELQSEPLLAYYMY